VSINHLVTAIKKVQAMTMADQVALGDEIYAKQPHLLAACLALPGLGVDINTVERPLQILFVCYQAMKESGLQWPMISENEQERQLKRLSGAALFSESIADAAAADEARRQYITSHPEQPLLAYVMRESNQWLLDLARRNVESESDKYVMMVSINLVNCIAYASIPARRV
jgi:hypothetical protein